MQMSTLFNLFGIRTLYFQLLNMRAGQALIILFTFKRDQQKFP